VSKYKEMQALSPWVTWGDRSGKADLLPACNAWQFSDPEIIAIGTGGIKGGVMEGMPSRGLHREAYMEGGRPVIVMAARQPSCRT